ncbi:MAG: DUF1844 domain-containing protein [Myxococcota bacterium]
MSEESDPKQERGFQMSDPPKGEELPKIDFSTFVLSLAASGLIHLGRAPELAGDAAPAEPNLPLARQTIDTLEMLEQKTRGNLDDEETKLIQSVLYELRMEFVRAEDGQ